MRKLLAALIVTVLSFGTASAQADDTKTSDSPKETSANETAANETTARRTERGGA
jgi:hypothetical protein